MILLVIGIYLLVGLGWYYYLNWLIHGKHADGFNVADKEQMDATVSMVIVMFLWPKIAFPFIAGIAGDIFKRLRWR